MTTLCIVAGLLLVALVMPLSRTYILSWIWGGNQVQTPYTVTVDGTAVTIDETVAHSASDQVVLNAHWAKLKIAAITLFAPAGGHDLTVYTNDVFGGSPQDTITVKAGGPAWHWNRASGMPYPFGASDITIVYVKNTGSTVADDNRLEGEIVIAQ